MARSATWASSRCNCNCTPTCRPRSRWWSSRKPERSPARCTVEGAPGRPRHFRGCRLSPPVRCPPVMHRVVRGAAPPASLGWLAGPRPAAPDATAGVSPMSARPGFRNDRSSDARIEQLRVPPHSVEAEQAVLGGLMLAPEAYDSVGDILVEGDFYRRDHLLIYRAIRELAEKSRPFDAVTLGEWFDSQGFSEQIGGGAYLVELATTTPSAANIRAYAEIVRDKAVLRQLIEIGTGIVNDGFQPEGRDSAALL